MVKLLNEKESNAQKDLYDDLYSYADRYRMTSRWTEDNVKQYLERQKKFRQMSDADFKKVVDKVNSDFKRKKKVKSFPYDENSYKKQESESVIMKLDEDNRYGVSEMIYDILDGHYSSSTGDINEQYLQDDVYMWLKNEKRLAKEITNTRRKVAAVVWQAFIDLINYYGDEEYGSGYGWKMDQKAVQRWFKKHGADYKEVLAPVVAEVEQLRKERLGKKESVRRGLRESNSYEEFSVTADTWSELIRKLEEATDLEIDSIYRDEPDKFIYGYDTDNNEYEIEVTRYRNGDYEILSDNVNLV